MLVCKQKKEYSKRVSQTLTAADKVNKKPIPYRESIIHKSARSTQPLLQRHTLSPWESNSLAGKLWKASHMEAGHWTLSCSSRLPYLHPRVDLVEWPGARIDHWPSSLVQKISKFWIPCITNPILSLTHLLFHSKKDTVLLSKWEYCYLILFQKSNLQFKQERLMGSAG